MLKFEITGAFRFRDSFDDIIAINLELLEGGVTNIIIPSASRYLERHGVIVMVSSYQTEEEIYYRSYSHLNEWLKNHPKRMSWLVFHWPSRTFFLHRLVIGPFNVKPTTQLKAALTATKRYQEFHPKTNLRFDDIYWAACKGYFFPVNGYLSQDGKEYRRLIGNKIKAEVNDYKMQNQYRRAINRSRMLNRKHGKLNRK